MVWTYISNWRMKATKNKKNNIMEVDREDMGSWLWGGYGSYGNKRLRTKEVDRDELRKVLKRLNSSREEGVGGGRKVAKAVEEEDNEENKNVFHDKLMLFSWLYYCKQYFASGTKLNWNKTCNLLRRLHLLLQKILHFCKEIEVEQKNIIHYCRLLTSTV